MVNGGGSVDAVGGGGGVVAEGSRGLARVTASKESPVEMGWVQCSRGGCRKWRRLENGVSSARFSKGRWYCHMNDWNLDFEDCLKEEETYTLLSKENTKSELN